MIEPARTHRAGLGPGDAIGAARAGVFSCFHPPVLALERELRDELDEDIVDLLLLDDREYKAVLDDDVLLDDVLEDELVELLEDTDFELVEDDVDDELDDCVLLVELLDVLALVTVLVLWLDRLLDAVLLDDEALRVLDELVIVCVLADELLSLLAEEIDLEVVEDDEDEDHDAAAVLLLDVLLELHSSSTASQSRTPPGPISRGRWGNCSTAAPCQIDAGLHPSLPWSRNSTRTTSPSGTPSTSHRTTLPASAETPSGSAPASASIRLCRHHFTSRPAQRVVSGGDRMKLSLIVDSALMAVLSPLFAGVGQPS